MSRSTIQEKLSGKTPATLAQILSLVEAFAEHARLIESPLSAEEIDKGKWRDIYTASLAAAASLTSSATPQTVPSKPLPEWDTTPLKLAQMHDLVATVESSADTPPSQWLPGILGPLLQAEMSCINFLKRAAQETPQEVVRIATVLHLSFPPYEPDPWETKDPWSTTPNEKTVGTFLAQVARVHAARSSPAIITGLRRANIGAYVTDFLNSTAKIHPAPNIYRIVSHLRAATLSQDAESLLETVGAERQVNGVIEIVEYFNDRDEVADKGKILRAVPSRNWYRLKSIAAQLESHAHQDDWIEEVLRGLPWGNNDEIVSQLQADGNHDLAQRVRSAHDKPPF
ncbi:hypothetical protein ACIODX_10405 [Streptomyces sp. NPDC088190]|uniref:hypothetical protein n=1 Tax=unclassified Streptomyces TaxID=2593676 RepID=UPI002E76D08A|nr:hypothetical protein [Streptomyces sp. JV190]MEE1840341.1 hypothetical protein [Streptomyces sp. JV190]